MRHYLCVVEIPFTRVVSWLRLTCTCTPSCTDAWAVLCYAVLTTGYGLAQRLLVMVDAAASPVGGDPFAALTPQLPASAAAAAGGDGAGGGSVCGSGCSWQGCMERLRLAHEGLLLLRALVATPGAVGECTASCGLVNVTQLVLVRCTQLDAVVSTAVRLHLQSSARQSTVALPAARRFSLQRLRGLMP